MAVRRWGVRLTMGMCLVCAALLVRAANRLHRAGLLRPRDASRALAGASWLARSAMRMWRNGRL